MANAVLERHRIEENAPLIRLTILGNQKPEDVLQRQEELAQLLSSSTETKDLLVDLTNNCHVDEQTQQQAIKAYYKLSFRRVAIIACKPDILVAMRNIVKPLDPHTNIKIFRNETDALNWLGLNSH